MDSRPARTNTALGQTGRGRMTPVMRTSGFRAPAVYTIAESNLNVTDSLIFRNTPTAAVYQTPFQTAARPSPRQAGQIG